MLIVCSGPDSYRALEKARELESAYRQKYDAEGRSVERLVSGKEGLDAVLSLTAGASLFSTRRFIRCDGLLSACPKGKRDALTKALSHDPEMTIVVSIEPKLLTDKEVSELSSKIKLVHYPFPALSVGMFHSWAKNYAGKFGFSDEKTLSVLIDAVQGDTWRFVTEFQKILAGGESCIDQSQEQNVFQVIESLFLQKQNRFLVLRDFDNNEQIIAQIINQSRSLVLAKSGETRGLHPFVAQKFARLPVNDLPNVYRRMTQMFIWSRSGFASADEAVELLG